MSEERLHTKTELIFYWVLGLATGACIVATIVAMKG